MKIRMFAAAIAAVMTFSAAYAEYDALERIGKYYLMIGRGDGDAMEEKLTRAELAVIVCKLAKTVPAGYDGEFADVAKAHWGAGYIKAAVDLGYAPIDEEGRFFPEQKVTYAQVARSLVKFAGYDEYAAVHGGYPEGYMNAAENLMKILPEGAAADAEVIRADMADMLSKMLDVKLTKIHENENATEIEISDCTVRDFLDGTGGLW